MKTMALAGLLTMAFAGPSFAITRVAVAAFDYTDHSGEVRDQKAFHDQHLAALQSDIIRALRTSKQAEAEPLRCATPPCSAGAMQADDLTRAAKAENAQYLVFGGVQKMSTLIQWGQVEVVDVQSGKSILSRTVTFRGDDDAAWQHASDYVGAMVLSAVK